MATSLLLVGSAECRIPKVISLLKSSPSFHFFHENWSKVAIDLHTPTDKVKKLRRDLLLDKLNLVDVVSDLMEEWVTRQYKEATIQVLLRALQANELNDCAASLATGLGIPLGSWMGNPGANATYLGATVKKYCRVPTGLQGFLKSDAKFHILRASEKQITCDKIKENLQPCFFHDWMGFVRLTSSTTLRGGSEFDIVTDFEINDLKKLSKVQSGDVNKVVFVTCGLKKDIQNVVDGLESEKLKVQVSSDDVVWADLTYAYQLEIREKLKKRYQIDFEDVECNGTVLIDLIMGNEVKLFVDTIPPELSYYVPRRFLPRYIISSGIFELTCSDIFLFAGMERYELCSLAKNNVTDNSSNQILEKELTVQYMVHDKEGDFNTISSMTIEPVHLLRYENGTFRWIQSKGPMRGIQKHIDMHQTDIDEEDFFRDVSSDSNRVVCISGVSGMGKSAFLAQTGRNLSRMFPTRAVHFIHLSEFISRFRSKAEFEVTANEVVSTLKGMVCSNVVGETVLNSKLNFGSESQVLVELLLDGFEEVDARMDRLALKILQTIKILFETIRMWITSHPFLLEELETSLNTLGFNMQPLTEDDQKQLVTSIWSGNTSIPYEAAKLRAHKYYQDAQIQEITLNDNMAIAGLPLRCHLLAICLQSNVEAYALSDNLANPKLPLVVPSDFNTVTSIYNRFIAMNLEMYRFEYGKVDFDEQALMKIHARLSMEIIFLKDIGKFRSMLDYTYIYETELAKVGIFKRITLNWTFNYGIMHRTIAEYFIAWFVINKLKDGDYATEGLMDFFLEHVLKRRTTGGTSPRHNFAYQMLAYFINSMLPDIEENIPSPDIHRKTRKSIHSKPTMHEIAYSCANDNFINIFKFFDKLKAFDQHAKTIFNPEFVLLTITNSQMELVKLGMAHFEQHHRFDSDTRVEILRAAVTGGDLSIVKYLLKKKSFGKTLKDKTNKATGLLHNCIENTKHMTASEIEQRVEIMLMLIGIKPKLLDERSNAGLSPLHSSLAHIGLLRKLIQNGSNVLARDMHGDTILHRADHFSAKEYHSILGFISRDPLKILVKVKGKLGRTPLMCAIRCFDPKPETFDLFKDMGADFDCADESGIPLMATAIALRRSANTLRRIAKYSANSAWHGAGAASGDKALPDANHTHIACPCCLQPINKDKRHDNAK